MARRPRFTPQRPRRWHISLRNEEQAMEVGYHTLPELFSQLGLPESDDAIEQFIGEHRPLPENVLLQDADFWNPSQADFLRQGRDLDAEWAIAIDELNTLLRHTDGTEPTLN